MNEAIMQAEDKVTGRQEEAIHQAKILTEIEKTQTEEVRDLPVQETIAIEEKIEWTEEVLVAPENALQKGMPMVMQRHCMTRTSNDYCIEIFVHQKRLTCLNLKL